MYLCRKSFAFDGDAHGASMTEKRKVFEMALSTAEATFQNLDSSEISLTDVSHYFDSDPTNLVQNLRKDGKKPNAYVADTTTANAQVRNVIFSLKSEFYSSLHFFIKLIQSQSLSYNVKSITRLRITH